MVSFSSASSQWWIQVVSITHIASKYWTTRKPSSKRLTCIRTWQATRSNNNSSNRIRTRLTNNLLRVLSPNLRHLRVADQMALPSSYRLNFPELSYNRGKIRLLIKSINNSTNSSSKFLQQVVLTFSNSFNRWPIRGFQCLVTGIVRIFTIRLEVLISYRQPRQQTWQTFQAITTSAWSVEDITGLLRT